MLLLLLLYNFDDDEEGMDMDVGEDDVLGRIRDGEDDVRGRPGEDSVVVLASEVCLAGFELLLLPI